MSADGDFGSVTLLNIQSSNGVKFHVQVNLDSSVWEFKHVLAQNFDVPVEQQRLIYKGRILKDDQTLDTYGLEADHTVHMVRGVQGALTNTTDAGNGGSTNSSPGVASSIDSTGLEFVGVDLDSSLFPEFGFNSLGGSGVSGLFGTEFSEFEQVQQQLTRNPNMMREIMNMPGIQNLMDDPDLMRNLIMSNPQMREIIDRNPDLAHVLNDPSIIRQTLEAARNPELMREMMRNTDRAMNNIEASPEGFNMLRRMYENVQEPFMNAGNSANDVDSNQFIALLGNQGGGQTSDQSTNSSTTGSETTISSAPNTCPLPNPWSRAGAAGGVQRNTTTRSTPAGDAKAPGSAGLGIPNMDQMLSGMQDASQLNQIMQNPAMSQVLQSVLSNPQYMNQILGLHGTLDSNPQFREMLQNPDLLRQLTSPETMQQMTSLQQSLLPLGWEPSMREPSQSGSGAGGLEADGVYVPNTSNVLPEERYATQLSQLQEMGFFNTQENIRALNATAGNVHAAVERLLGNPGQ